jgi:translation elongation factor EF-4
LLLVIYKDGTSKLVRNPSDFPDTDERSLRVSKLQEPMVLATLIFPDVRFHNFRKTRLNVI